MSPERIRKISSFKRDERGVQLVELAIVLPVLVLLFAAAAEFGRYSMNTRRLQRVHVWRFVIWRQL